MSEKPVVIQTTSIPAPMQHAEDLFTVLRMDEAADPQDFLIDKGAGVAVAMGRHFTAAMAAGLPDLKLFVNFGVDYDGVDLEVARA